MQSPLHPAADAASLGCCVFLRRPSSLSRLGYRALPPVGAGAGATVPGEDDAVRVVVGKERRVFFVDPFVLDKEPFRILMETVSSHSSNGRSAAAAAEQARRRGGGAIFVDVDAILFEHMLWLVYNECSSSSSASLFHLNLKEIIEFYAQDN